MSEMNKSQNRKFGCQYQKITKIERVKCDSLWQADLGLVF
jgi:hypothetical protein